jgi:hypothetical protein
MTSSPEIECPACGRESLLLRQPKYEGFKRVGEILSCASCGFVFASEADVPFKLRKRVEVFTEADRTKTLRVFDEKEIERLCRHCAHYTVNPFVQWCGLHRREVEATDTCPAFTPRGERKKPVL